MTKLSEAPSEWIVTISNRFVELGSISRREVRMWTPAGTFMVESLQTSSLAHSSTRDLGFIHEPVSRHVSTEHLMDFGYETRLVFVFLI